MSAPLAWELAPVVPTEILIVLGVLAAILTAAAFAPDAVSVSRRISLGVLRLLALSVLAVILLRPSSLTTEAFRDRPRVAILVDRSQSFQLRDARLPGEANPVSRARAADHVLSRLRAAWRERGEDADLSVMEFGSRPGAPRALDAPESGPFRHTQGTDIAAAIDAAAREMPGAIILIGDGRATAGRNPVAAAAGADAPCFTVAFGRDASDPPATDLSVRALDAPRAATVGASVPVDVRVAGTGLPQDCVVRVRLQADGKFAGERQVRLSGDGGARVRFTHVPRREGTVRYDAEATADVPEATTENNRATAFVRVRREVLRLVYAEGRLRWDYRFLRQALASIPGVELQTIPAFLKGGEGLRRMDGRWREAHVIVLGELPGLDRNHAGQIRDAVAGGAGLLLVAGAPGYAGPAALSLWREILPVRADEWKSEGATSVRLVPGAATHPALPRGFAGTLPNLPSRIGGGRVTAAGRALLRAEDGAPLLVVGRYGTGRTAVILSGESHVWAHDEKADPRAYRALVAGLVGYVGGVDLPGRGGLTVRLSSHLLRPGDLVTVRAEYLPPDPGAEDAVRVGATLRKVDASAAEEPRFEAGASKWLAPTADGYAGSFEVPEAGDYRVVIAVTAGDRTVVRRSVPLLVQGTAVEMENLSADHGLLERLATVSGGRSYRPGQVDELISDLEPFLASKTVPRSDRRELWDRFWVLGVLLSLLFLEWWLRTST